MENPFNTRKRHPRVPTLKTKNAHLQGVGSAARPWFPAIACYSDGAKRFGGRSHNERTAIELSS